MTELQQKKKLQAYTIKKCTETKSRRQKHRRQRYNIKERRKKEEVIR